MNKNLLALVIGIAFGSKAAAESIKPRLEIEYPDAELKSYVIKSDPIEVALKSKSWKCVYWSEKIDEDSARILLSCQEASKSSFKHAFTCYDVNKIVPDPRFKEAGNQLNKLLHDKIVLVEKQKGKDIETKLTVSCF